MKATDTQGLSLSVSVQGHKSVYWPGKLGRLWTDAETLHDSFDFRYGKHIFIVSFATLK